MNNKINVRDLLVVTLVPLAGVLSLGSCRKQLSPRPEASLNKAFLQTGQQLLTSIHSAPVQAKFNNLTGTAVDGSGNIYVADSRNHRIRMITPGGAVTTLAGDGTQGFRDGSGGSAEFSFPNGIAVDRQKNVYVADFRNHRIRKITPAGIVSTYAGTGAAGNRNGIGDSAQFDSPAAVAVDGNGNVYVADEGNRMIRKITRNRVVSTVAGNGIFGYVDGPGATAEFSNPEYIASDPVGNLYVTDGLNNRIRKISRSGLVSLLTGTQAAGILDGPLASAQFHLPTGIAIDSAGNLYVSDQFNNRIRKITPDGFVSTLAGHGNGLTLGGFADGPPETALFDGLSGLSVDVAGNVYLADLNNQRVRKISPAGITSTLAGTGDAAFADGRTVDIRYGNPEGAYCDAAGNVFVVDAGHHRIMKITPLGIVSVFAGSGVRGFRDDVSAAAQFSFPSSIVGDSTGNLYVADAGNNRIRKITPDGMVTSLAGNANGSFQDGQGPNAGFNGPVGIAIDAAGVLYVADANNNRIRKVTLDGNVNTIAGDGIGAFKDGTGTAAEFNLPSDVAVDGLGNVYVADAHNNRIRKITPAGVVTTLAGDGTPAFKDAPTGPAAEFNFPRGVMVDRSRNVYVADYSNNRIRKITPKGVVSTLAGTGEEGYRDGPAAGAVFTNPFDLAMDGKGNIYVTDWNNQLIRKISHAGIVSIFSGSGLFFQQI